MSSGKITFEQLQHAMETRGLSASKLTLEKMCADYDGYCPRCANPGVSKAQKYDCGCNAPKIVPNKRN